MSLQLPGLTELTEVGRGAYGVVYRARQDQLRRYVAVKVLNARLGDTAAKRFAQESQALGALSGHPHIVTVHEAGTTPDGVPYLVMPFCEHGSLADRTAHSGPLPWQEVLDVGIRLAGALQAAHDAGILHRDLKPSNVLVDSYGTPRLADFGQARHADTDLTSSGAVVGSPAYSAPEVLRGEPANPASDVHALAATMAALVTGLGPYTRRQGENVAAVMYRTLNEPPVNLRQYGVPDEVCKAVEWALDKDPVRRPPSAVVFGKALQGLQRRHGLQATPLVVPGALAGDPGAVATPLAPIPTPAPGPQPAHPFSGPAAAPGGPLRQGWPPAPPGTPAPRQRRAAWLIAAAVALAAAVTASLLIFLPDSDTTTVDPNDLLLDGEDYGLGQLTADGGGRTMFVTLLDKPGPAPRVTDLAACLELPVDQIADWNHSALYVRGTPVPKWTVQPEAFSSAESAGVVMNSEADARLMAEHLTGTLWDSCLRVLLTAGVGVLGTKATPQTTALDYDDIQPPDGLSERVSAFGGKHVKIPLKFNQTAGRIGTLYIDVTIQAVENAVLITIVQHYPDEPTPDMMNTVSTAMADKLSAV